MWHAASTCEVLTGAINDDTDLLFLFVRGGCLLPHVVSCVRDALELPLTNVLVPVDALSVRKTTVKILYC